MSDCIFCKLKDKEIPTDVIRRFPRPHPEPLGRVGGDGQCRQGQNNC